jgi:hypothetical protein
MKPKLGYLIVDLIFDGDFLRKVQDVPYSANIRDVFTLDDMQKYHEKGEQLHVTQH